ncbi:hypothetical protein [Helcococcus ovis]|nr:hypothetical protein [Helcococcus ovis]WNZ00774.1 hypothetical protein EQF90_005800 [Helcococcus ovis]
MKFLEKFLQNYKKQHKIEDNNPARAKREKQTSIFNNIIKISKRRDFEK